MVVKGLTEMKKGLRRMPQSFLVYASRLSFGGCPDLFERKPQFPPIRVGSDVDGVSLHGMGGLHQGFAQGGVGVDVAADLSRGEFHHLGQGQFW